MRTLISLNGWWGFFFRQNMQILAFITIFMAILVTDLGDAWDCSNDQLVKGRYSLHRVGPLKGSTPCYVAILPYVEQPDILGTPERVKRLYGRVLRIHLERASLRGDSYLD
ncbi:hypothetical protein N9847_01065 [bacterium]|nr:hypothetical protein [bacterium]